MKATKTLSRLGLLWAAALATVFVACQPIGQRGASQPPRQEGTTDGGGGTGFDGKVYESYIVDISKHPAYLKYLSPVFDKLTGQTPTDNQIMISTWNEMWRMKTWYIAPLKLKKSFSKEVLGYSSSKDDYEIYAVNREREIVIDKGYFDKMNEREQADIIQHEIVMSVYFLKFKKMSDLCVVLKNAFKNDSNCEETKQIDELFPAVPARALTEKDNVNIRTMTGVLLNPGGRTPKEIVAKFVENEFDERLFQMDWSERLGSSSEAEELKIGELEKIIVSAKVLNQLPNHCTFITSVKGGPCKLEFLQNLTSPLRGQDLPAFGFRISYNGDVIYNERGYSQGSHFATKTFDPISKRFLYMIPLTPVYIDNPKVGDAYRMMILFASKDDRGFRFEGVAVLPSVITSVTIKDPSAALKEYVCTADAPTPTKLSEDRLVVRRSGSLPGYMEWVSQRMQVMAPCY